MNFFQMIVESLELNLAAKTEVESAQWKEQKSLSPQTWTPQSCRVSFLGVVTGKW